MGSSKASSRDSTSAYTPELARSIYAAIQQYRNIERIHYYVCGHCGTAVTGWAVSHTEDKYQRRWLLCPQCGRGSVQNDDAILPPPQTFGNIDGLPDGIDNLYDEARASFGAQAYTGCEMLCRKILMNTAVNKGAEKNKRFVEYVDYLDSHGHITPSLKDMATIVKDNGNDAAHEVDPPDRERAEYTLEFTRSMLYIVYGMKHKLDKYGARAGQTGSSP